MVCVQGGLSGLHIVGRTFCGLRLQGQTEGCSISNIFKGSFTEEGTGVGKAILEEEFKFESFEARRNFDITDSAVQREEDRPACPSTQGYKKMEGKMTGDLTGE